MHVFFIQKLDIISKEVNAKFGSKNVSSLLDLRSRSERYICSPFPVGGMGLPHMLANQASYPGRARPLIIISVGA